MKKRMIFIMAGLLALSFGTAVPATENAAPGNNQKKEIEVTAKYTDGTSAAPVYSVDIRWDGMTFTYHESESRIWNPATHTYTDTTTAGWDKTTAAVTVANHSNVKVQADFQYEAAAGADSGVTGTLDPATEVLEAGKENDPENPDQAVSIFTISGIPNRTVTPEGVKIGTITVSITGNLE